MQLSNRATTSFKQLYFKHFGVELADNQVQEKAFLLLNFVKLFYRPVSMMHKTVLEGYKTT